MCAFYALSLQQKIGQEYDVRVGKDVMHDVRHILTRTYRKLNNMTQEKLAEYVDVDINSSSSVERGKFFPSPDNLIKIAKALKISLSDLFTFSEKLTAEDYSNEIASNLELIKKDKTKLCAVNAFIKSILAP